MEKRSIQTLLTDVAQHWRGQRLPQASPASGEEVAEFEARYGIRLPADVRAYFTTLNGSADGSNGPMDDLLLAFWHLSEVRPLGEAFDYTFSIPVPGSEGCFVFADWSIIAHVYVLRLTPDDQAPTPVYVAYDDVLVEIAPSFRAFLEGYVVSDQDMLFPDPPPELVARYRDRAV